MSLAQCCTGAFEPHIRSRGETYFYGRNVDITTSFARGVEADVEGSRLAPYSVSLNWTRASQGVVQAYCSCPHFRDGFLCKHVWATILKVDETGLALGTPQTYRMQVLRDAAPNDEFIEDEIFNEDDYDVSAAPTRSPYRDRSGFARTPPGHQRNASNWQHQLPVGQQQDERGYQRDSLQSWRDASSTTSQAWYVLNVGASLQHGKLLIDFYYRQTRKDGQFGKIKRLSVRRNEKPAVNEPEDVELLQLLLGNQAQNDARYNAYYYSSPYFQNEGYSRSAVAPAMFGLLLPRLSATGRFVWQLNDSLPIEEARHAVWDDGPAWQFRLHVGVDESEKRWSIDGQLYRDGEVSPLSEAVLLLSHGLVLFPDRLACLDAAEEFSWISALRKSAPIQVPYADRDLFLTQLWSSSHLPDLDLPGDLQVNQLRLEPQGKLSIKSPERFGRTNQLHADISYVYEGQTVSLHDQHAAVFDSENDNVILRSPSTERELLNRLHELGLRPLPHYQSRQADLQFAKKRLPDVVDQLTASGWVVECEGRLIRRPGAFSWSVTSDVDWFELDASVDFDGVTASLPSLLKAVRSKQKYVRLDDGTQGMLPQEWLDRYGGLIELGEQDDETLKFAPSQALLLDSLLAEQEQVQVDHQFDKFRQQLRSFAGVDPCQEPRGFSGELRTYQQEGLGWLNFLRDFRFGGCLADDMGLGKTIQVLALLQARRLRRPPKGQKRTPSIAIVPKSLVFNWIDEAARFTPRLRVLDYTGLDRASHIADFDQYDLILTTYGILRRDIAQVKDVPFDYAILDEAQAIKNANSQASKACRLLHADHRLAMTGTPVENHLGELWALFEFLNPGMLGRSSAFSSLTKNGRNREEPDATLPMLGQALRPFLLRRTKAQVLTELPEKNEQTLHCEMAPKQRKLYDELRDYYRASLSQKVKEVGIQKAKIHVLEALLRLRQAACHPGLIDKKRADEPSAKLDLLMEQISEIVDEGHKALIFSQFTSLLSIVRDRFDKQGITYEYLDGRSRKRKDKVTRFQEDADCPLFLISLKAGGHGLNLTAADYVYILDPWWNPAVEAQAVDRVHRIGQTRRVFAYRMICRDSVEEKIVDLQREKRELADAIVSADNSLIRNLSAEDLRLLLS